MRRSPVPTVAFAAPTVALVLGVTLLVDVLRVWLPSIITIFGQAAATPAELLGAFALSWFLMAFAAPPLVRLVGPIPVALAAAVVLAACRIALPATGGGSTQLYAASLGLLAGLVWLAATAARVARPVPGLVLGLAAATVGHTALGTYDLVWRPDAWAWAVGGFVALAFVASTVLASTAGATTGTSASATGVASVASAASQVSPPGAPAGGARSWFLFGPALLLSGLVAGSPALLRTGLSYGTGLAWPSGGDRLGDGIAQSGPSDAPLGVLLGAVAVAVFVAGGLPPAYRLRRWVGAALLLAGAFLFAMAGPGGLLPLTALVPAIVTTAAGLGISLGATDRPTAESAPPAGLGEPAGSAVPVEPGEPAGSAATVESVVPVESGGSGEPGEPPAPGKSAARRGFAAVAGMTVFAVAAVAYYAAYDLGYPNRWVPVAVATLVAAVALPARATRVRPAPARATRVRPAPAHATGVRPTPARPTRVRPASARPAGTGRALAATLAAILAGILAPGTAPPAPARANGPVRLVAYNIRMGFGLDGRFDLERLARVIARQNPDVVALSEVDRAWLLNGGHDTVALLARRLGLSYVFAPAADPVWGDAVLTRLPVRAARTVALPAVGAPTGAQALAVVLDVGGRELVVVSTHLQPPPDGGPVAQAEATARFATSFAAGRPLVVAGDLNTEPGEPAFEALRAAGLVDALAASRPLPTSPADEPAQQIDHVLVSPGLVAADAVAPRSIASDHLPVAVTLTLPAAG